MTTKLETAFIIIAIIGIVFLAILVVAGFGSTESAVGHFLKDTFHGTPVEQTAVSLESAGTDLTTAAHKALTIFTGLIVLVGLVYWRSRS
jgi:hypothetical protein